MSDSKCNCPCVQQGGEWCIKPNIHPSHIINQEFRGSGSAGIFDVIDYNFMARVQPCPHSGNNPAIPSYNCKFNSAITPVYLTWQNISGGIERDEDVLSYCNALPEVEAFLNTTGYIFGVEEQFQQTSGTSLAAGKEFNWIAKNIQHLVDNIPYCEYGGPPTVVYRVAYQLNCGSGNPDPFKCINEILKETRPGTARPLDCSPSPCTKLGTFLFTQQGWWKASTIDYYDKYVDGEGTDTNGIRVLHDILEKQEYYTGKVFVGVGDTLSGVDILTAAKAYPAGDTPWSPPLI
tara:strand:- start:1799 stop:2671 length:873 start_codon:yes stop_codon:yes gene_type:complete